MAGAWEPGLSQRRHLGAAGRQGAPLSQEETADGELSSRDIPPPMNLGFSLGVNLFLTKA